MPRRPPETTLTATLFPYTTLFRSEVELRITGAGIERRLAVRDKPQGRTEGRAQALATTGVIGINRRRPLGHIRQTLACSTAQGRRGFCRSEEHTSELQSLLRISYAVFCLKKNRYNSKHI